MARPGYHCRRLAQLEFLFLILLLYVPVPIACSEQGISQTIGNAAAIPAVPLAATIANVAGWDTVFMFLAGCYACAAAIFWRWGTAERLFGPAG